jgi:hypothetical protein
MNLAEFHEFFFRRLSGKFVKFASIREIILS